MISSRASRICRYGAALAGIALCAAATAQERPLVLLIQPTLGEEATRQSFQPLADYLSQAAGVTVTVVAKPNFFAHWDTVRRNAGYDLVLDDAHFTDYRVRKFGFRVLAKLPGMASYSLVVPRERRVLDPMALAGKRVASFGPPSIGATRLNAMFPNPARRPVIVDIASVNEGLDLLWQEKVEAAMLPTSAVADHITGGRLRAITTTEPILQMALSASPQLRVPVREKIRAALLQAGRSPEPDSTTANIDRFEPATAAMYANQARMLQQYCGY
jgi:hypothetical protein